ncbi:hypothetical protein SELMODRAFT_430069 [Selaginella moellendorffii]|uniref:Remorin C-terminal domain-containing protein n=1 Tax=Selaginella moellendorffii TaxID=88036 RepID=D8T883_SELML|nr:hypothetical protein SELMODRAFT_430069 [Selaginella moellendorffii]
MGDMDVDDHQDRIPAHQASPRPTGLQMLSPRQQQQMMQQQHVDDITSNNSSVAEDAFKPPPVAPPSSMIQELPPPPTPQRFPPPVPDEQRPAALYDFSPPPAPERRGSSQQIDMLNFSRAAPQYDQVPVMDLLRRASQFDQVEQTPGAGRRASSQFHDSFGMPDQRRPSALVEGMHDRPNLPPVLTSVPVADAAMHDHRPSLLLQQPYNLPQSSATPTPRLSSNNFVPVKRAPISETEPYSPVSSSGEGVGGHIDRDAMLARAYQDKQQSQVKAWERHRNTKNYNKYESEIARITAWEACQVAKAEALMKKSEARSPA